jgi:hypothetical protein
MRQARNTEPPSGHRHSSVSVLAVIASAVAITACGSSSASHSAGGSSAAAQELKFTDCMRSHGVPNLPDSSVAGVLIPIGSTINPQSPAFKSALWACAKLLPGGGPGSAPASAQRKAQALQLSECMRRTTPQQPNAFRVVTRAAQHVHAIFGRWNRGTGRCGR